MHTIKKSVFKMIVTLIGLSLLLPVFADEKGMEVNKIVALYHERVAELDGCLRNNEVYAYTASKWRGNMLAKMAKNISQTEINTVVNPDTLKSCSSTCKIAVISLETCGDDFPKKAEEAAGIADCTACCEKLAGVEGCSIPL